MNIKHFRQRYLKIHILAVPLHKFLVLTILLTTVGIPTATVSADATSGKVYTIANANGGDTTGVFRPSNGVLYLKNSNTTGFADIALNYGLPGDKPVTGDWDGNGTVTIGIYRDGMFYLRNSNTIGFGEIVFPFGNPGDQPIVGDWDGDGVDTIGVYRCSVGRIFLRNSNTSGFADVAFSFFLSSSCDQPVVGDWDGNGTDDIWVYRSSIASFLRPCPVNLICIIPYIYEPIRFGLPGDIGIAGDWNGDGIDTIGVYRNGTFFLRNSNDEGFADIVFDLGIPGDMPIAGNWDGLPWKTIFLEMS